MKLEENSYYIQYYINKGAEYASISHYGEVWDNGYTVDVYNIGDSCIYFEDASWNGVSITLKNKKQILSREFNNWVKEIETTKKLLINMGRNARISYAEDIKKGDSLFCIVPPYDEEEECYYFLEVIDKDNEKIAVRYLSIDKYYFNYNNSKHTTIEEDNWLDIPIKAKTAFLIKETVFNKAINIFQQLTKKLISEIKREYEKSH